MTKVTFLLSKDPVTAHGGDIELSRVMMRLAAEMSDVSVICLAAEAGSEVADLVPGGLPVTRVAKGPVRPRKLLVDAVRTRRSLVHVRFDIDELLDAIESADADVFIAEHSYMAETFLRSSRFGKTGFLINTINTESQVWRATRGLLGRIEAPRLLRDEIRVGLAADAVGCYEIEESEMYRENGVRGARWMDLTLAPIAQIDVAATARRLVFVGARDWPPNQEAFLYALRLWPRIAAGIPDAELCVIGAKKRGAKDPVYPDGVRDLGFVKDLSEFLGTCRALMAPIKTGGGVRVKLLDAIRMGLPVIGTGPAIGSLRSLFEFTTFDDDELFIAECRRLLLDRDAAVDAGNKLYELNTAHWQQRRPHRAVEDLLGAGIRA